MAWVRDVMETRPGEHRWPVDTEAGCARFLLARIGILRMHPAAGDVCTEVRSAVAWGYKVVDNPAPRWFAGPCDECAAPLYAEVGAIVVTCRTGGCHTRHDVAARRAFMLDAARDELLSIPEMLRVLPQWTGAPLTDSTLRSWRHRGRLVHHGLTMSGKETFRVGDVLDLLDAGTARAG